MPKKPQGKTKPNIHVTSIYCARQGAGVEATGMNWTRSQRSLSWPHPLLSVLWDSGRGFGRAGRRLIREPRTGLLRVPPEVGEPWQGPMNPRFSGQRWLHKTASTQDRRTNLFYVLHCPLHSCLYGWHLGQSRLLLPTLDFLSQTKITANTSCCTWNPEMKQPKAKLQGKSAWIPRESLTLSCGQSWNILGLGSKVPSCPFFKHF